MRRKLARLLGLTLAGSVACAAAAAESLKTPACKDDVMLVFDASGSMAGTDFNNPPTPRTAKVKTALGQVLPGIAELRKIGLIDYGPGPYNRCDNIELQLRPAPHAAPLIMDVVERLVPAGRTPLTSAVREAAEVLDFPAQPGEIVLVTDGEETCGGDPCGLARSLRAQGSHLTIHVIGYRAKDSSEGPGYLQTRCLADLTGGLYLTAETTDDLVKALNKTLSCPEVSRLKRNGNDMGQFPPRSGSVRMLACQSSDLLRKDAVTMPSFTLCQEIFPDVAGKIPDNSAGNVTLTKRQSGLAPAPSLELIP